MWSVQALKNAKLIHIAFFQNTRGEKILKLLKLTNSEESKQEIPSNNIPNEESNNIVPLNPTPSDNNSTDTIYEHLVVNKINDTKVQQLSTQ